MGFKVVVVGAGLSGCLLTNGLLNNGVDAVLYERDVVNSKREGYQIRLGDAAIAGFRMCLKESHTAAILAKLGQSTGSTSSAPCVFTSSGRLLLDLSKIPSYSKSSAINRVVLRDILAQPLMDSGKLQFGKAFSHYEIVPDDRGSDKVCVYFGDGTHETCDVLVGADGSASKVNTQVGVSNLVKITSHWSFLAKGKLPASRINDLPQHLLKSPMMVFSRGASMYYSLYLPVKAGAASNKKKALEYDEEAASFYWALNVPRTSILYDKISDIPDRRRLCLDYVKDWAPEFTTMLSIGEMDEDTEDIYATQFCASHKPSKAWRSNFPDQSNGEGHPRIWLIGDAIHAMQPTRGMGGNQALLDCADMVPELVRLSGQYDSHGGSASTEDIKNACRHYEDKMLERSFTWVQKSGGSSMVSINLDGPLGYILYFVGRIVVPLVMLYYRVVQMFSPTSSEKM